MALQDKYAELINSANSLGVTNLAVAEKDGVLHVSGTAAGTADYDSLWALYDKIDPNMSSGDLMMNLDIKAAIDEKIKTTPEMAGAMADVKDGVATISGEVKDEQCKAMCETEITKIKGVKSVNSDNFENNKAIIYIEHTLKFKELVDKILKASTAVKLSVATMNKDAATLSVK